jgi:hypothetical protein
LPIEVVDGGEAGAQYVVKAEVAKLFTAARDDN